MPDFHLPDDDDRRAAEAAGAADLDLDLAVDLDVLRQRAGDLGLAGAQAMDREELLRWLRSARPSSRHDPAAPDRPQT